MRLVYASVLLLSLHATAAHAHRILITNDDGLTSNVRALYAELKAAGHDVIVSVPCTGQSGMGGAIKFLRPIGPLATDCLNKAAKAGDPGFGPFTRSGFENDWYYVDGTPVMATLYGLDVLARQRWGGNPDLVLSGPNEGQNVGAIVISSGTVNNVQYVALRGVPAIALSAGMNTVDNANLANPLSNQVARLTRQFVDHLSKAFGLGFGLPKGVSLNVNFPDALEAPKWRMTKIGTYNSYDVRFETMPAAGSDAAKPSGRIGIDVKRPEPTADQAEDEAFVVRQAITVSPMQVGYDLPASVAGAWQKKLKASLP